MRTLPLALLAVAALLAAGCGDARAAPEPGRPEPEASAQDVAGGTPPALPDVVGADLDEARAALSAAGTAGVRVLAFDPDGAVTAQQPAAGAPVDDDPVLVWLGDPPAPPPPSETTREAAAEPTAETTDDDAAEP
ncbi:MAG: PASTA domain-containing protein, partial [Actinomycetota bacterium]